MYPYTDSNHSSFFAIRNKTVKDWVANINYNGCYLVYFKHLCLLLKLTISAMWSIQVYVEKKSVFAKWWKERKYVRPVTFGATGRLCVVTWEGFQTLHIHTKVSSYVQYWLKCSNLLFQCVKLSLLFLIKEEYKFNTSNFLTYFNNKKKKNAEKALMVTNNLSFFSFRTDSIECNHGTCTPLGCQCDPCYTGDSCSEYSKY